jgi:CRP-like cAMP-binding protein
MEKINSMIF